MDADRRRRLEQRRRERQKEAELGKRRESIREQTDLLDAGGVPYALLFDDSPHVEWIRQHFPLTGGLFSPRIDWARVPVHERGPEPDDGDAAVIAWLHRIADEHMLGDPEVVLLTGDGMHPSIRLAFSHLRSRPQVASLRPEVWVACKAGDWALEFQLFGTGWGWGRAPGDR